MTTLHFSPSASHTSSAGSRPAGASPSNLSSHIGADLESLAQHMRHCASTRHRQSRFQLALEDACSLASPRIVTLVAVASLLAVAAASVVIDVLGIL